MHINLGNTSGTKLNASDGQTYECKCKLTGDFGISAASDKLSHYGSNYDGFSVVITDYSYGTYIDIQSLYIVAKVSDGKNDSSAEWTAASLPLTLRLSNSLFKSCMYPSLVVALAYKDGAGQSWSWKGTGISDISGATSEPWSDALSADNGTIASKARIHGTAYTYTQSYSNQVTDFLDNISLGGYEAAAQQVATYSQGTNVGLYTPKTGVTQTGWIAKGSSSGVWLWLLSNEAHKNTGSATITIDAKLYRGTADSTAAKTCTLTIGDPYKKDSNKMWYVDVSDGTNTVGTKTVQDAYKAGWVDGVATVQMDSCTVSRYDTNGHPTNTVRGRARCKWKANWGDTSYTYSDYMDSTNSLTYTPASYSASSHTDCSYTASSHNNPFFSAFSKDYNIWYGEGSAASAATKSDYKGLSFYRKNGDHTYTASSHTDCGYTASAYTAGGWS